MQIHVELFGIARQRAGTSHVEVCLSQEEARLADVLERLGALLPGFGRECLVGGRLEASLAVNLDGQRFVTDPATPVAHGQCLLILSADAGG